MILLTKLEKNAVSGQARAKQIVQSSTELRRLRSLSSHSTKKNNLIGRQRCRLA